MINRKCKLTKRVILAITLVAVMLFSVVSAVLLSFNFGGSGLQNYPISVLNNGTLGLSKTTAEQQEDEVYDFTRKSLTASGKNTVSSESGSATDTGEQRFSQTEAAAVPQADEMVTFIVELNEEPLLSAFSVDDISAGTAQVNGYQSRQTQALDALESSLISNFGQEEGFGLGFRYTVATTGLSVTTQFGNKAAIAALPGVERVYVAPTFEVQASDTETMTNNATGMIGADQMNQTGYTGKGMKIAIVDTGIVVDHPSFGALSDDKLTDTSMTKEFVDSVWNQLNAHKTTRRNAAYYNSKLPFIFNYATLDFDVSHQTAQHDHGTHVAGIAAANKIDSTSVVGVAPDAQLIVMQVFNTSGGANWDTIMAALEDCVHLNVDAINLSLGSAAGFTDNDAQLTTILNRFKDTDIQVLIAAGNDTNNGYMNRTGTNLSKATEPDNALIASPATASAAMAVASADNDGAELLYFEVDGKKIGFSDTAVTSQTGFLSKFKNQELEFVAVSGNGEAKDYTNLDVKGKVAVVSRGVTSFQDKQAAAKEAGAVACIVYNNEPGTFSMVISDGNGHIPCISVYRSDGEYLKNKNTGKLKVCNGDTVGVRMDKSMSSFSSWGVTPDLKLKPEVTGVGGSVYSTRDTTIGGSNYGEMSGTSMAAPQVTGAMAVLTQYLRQTHNYKESELRKVAANLMMSTASQMMDGDVEYSPRNQGAGLVDLAGAVKAGAYLSSPDTTENRPKGEMGDDPNKTGVFTFPFQVTNISNKTKTYRVDSSVLMPALSQSAYMSNSDQKLEARVRIEGNQQQAVPYLKYDFNNDGKITTADALVLRAHISKKRVISQDDKRYAYLDINGDGKIDNNDVKIILNYCAERKVAVDMMATVMPKTTGSATEIRVEPGQTVMLNATVTLTENDKKLLNESFGDGTYVEGYLYLNTTDSDSANLSMPFMGFYGDWSTPAVFDTDDANASLYTAAVYTNGSKLGINPYFTGGKSGGDYNAISYANPLAEINLGLLRNAKKLEFVVKDTSTQQEYFKWSEDDVRKTYYSANYGQIIPYYLANFNNEITIWDGKNNGSALPDGTKATYEIRAYLDDGDDVVDDIYQFDVTIDNQKPQITNANNLASELKKENGKLLLPIDLKDNHRIAALMFVNSEGVTMGKYEVDNQPGVEYKNTYDVSGYGSDFTIVVADYAMNETELKVSLDLSADDVDASAPKKLDTNRLYGSETYTQAALSRGWFSANKSDFKDYKNETFDTAEYYYSAEFVNGYVVGQRASDGALVLLTPLNTYWKTQTLLKQEGKVGEANVFVLYDMALDYNSNKLYAVGWRYSGQKDSKGKDTGGNKLFEVQFNGDKIEVKDVAAISGLPSGVEALTLGCTTGGQLYTISTEAKLYKLGTEGKVQEVGTTDFVNKQNYSGANVIQSMGYDHNTNTMYWYAHSQTKSGNSYINVCETYQVDLSNAKCTEVGNYGESGNTSLFVPTEKTTSLFTIGVAATDFTLSESKVTMATGQEKRLGVEWKPWNAKTQKVTWSSDDEKVATVNATGAVKAMGSGKATITATAEVTDANNTTTQLSRTVEIEVVGSASAIYGYVANDFKNAANNSKWVTFSDVNPSENTKQISSTGNQLWQGGAYYNGYVYTVVSTGSSGAPQSQFYKSKVNKGTTPEQTTIESPQLIGTIDGVEIGNIAYDYSTGRMYGVDYTNGGLCLLDIDSGAVDLLGTFNGDLKPAIMPAMCVTKNGTVIGSDMSGNLYTVNPDTMECKNIASIGEETWYYADMTYDHNTGNIYWNPCMGKNYSPLYLIRLDESKTDNTEVLVMNIGNVSTKEGVQQTAMFTIPDNEPATNYIKVTDIKITNGNITGLKGGTLQLNTKTTPTRPTANAKVWTSENPDIVSVDRFGKITFNKVGKTKITVSVQNKGNDTSTFTDTIEVEVKEAAGELIAFLAYDEGGSSYYDYWLTMQDYALREAELKDGMINTYSLRTGEYYDGYIYAYNNSGQFYRINAKNYADYVTLGDSGLDMKTDQVVSMTFDYKTGKMYGLTLSGYLGEIDLKTGKMNKQKALNQKVFTLAVDKNGTMYAAGSPDQYSYASLYTVDQESGKCTWVTGLHGANVYTGQNYMDELQYNAQMTYNYATNRLYLNATAKTKSGYSANSGMYMIELSDDQNSTEKVTQIVNYGKPSIKLSSGKIKQGDMYLGLLISIPREEDLPEGNVTGIVLNKSSARVSVGKTMNLTAIVQPAKANNKQVQWKSSDEKIVKVDQNGKVTGVKAGTAVITATSAADAKITATCTVTVIGNQTGTLAYTISAKKDALLSFDPENPASTMQVVATLSRGAKVVGMDMINETSFYYVVEDTSASPYPQLYHYNINTKKNTYRGTLEVNIGNAADMAYDAKNKLIYVASGFYVYQFEESKVQTTGITYHSAAFDSTLAGISLPAVHAVTCKDGMVYFLANNNKNKLYRMDDHFKNLTLVREIAVNTVSGKSEMAYNSKTGTFYLTDATDKLYSFKETGDITPIDILADGVDINGITIKP